MKGVRVNPAGVVDMVDLLQCSLPGDQDLVTVALTGRDLHEILNVNIPAGRFRKLNYTTTDMPFTVALYGHAARSPELRARVEGRVQEIR